MMAIPMTTVAYTTYKVSGLKVGATSVKRLREALESFPDDATFDGVQGPPPRTFEMDITTPNPGWEITFKQQVVDASS
jgi:hypothetical protein